MEGGEEYHRLLRYLLLLLFFMCGSSHSHLYSLLLSPFSPRGEECHINDKDWKEGEKEVEKEVSLFGVVCTKKNEEFRAKLRKLNGRQNSSQIRYSSLRTILMEVCKSRIKNLVTQRNIKTSQRMQQCKKKWDRYDLYFIN